MQTTHLAHRLFHPGLTALAVVVLYGLLAPGGSQAQTPAVPTPTATTNPSIALTATALQQRLIAQQQAAATPTTIPNLAAKATYVAAVTQSQAALATPIPTITPSTSVTPVTIAVTTPATATAPSGATAQDACTLSLASVSGGETIEFEQIAVTLPAGNFTYGFVRPDNGNTPQVVICNMQTASTIYLDARTGAETARRASGDTGATSLNQIQAGVRGRGAATPATISPPNTGDAGLR